MSRSLTMHNPGGVKVLKTRDFSPGRGAFRTPNRRFAAWRARLASALCAGLAALTPAAALTVLPETPSDWSRPAASTPALWVVADGDTTIYIFGTFHALGADSGWFSANVRAAFDLSNELVLETLVPDDPAELYETLVRHSLAAPMRPGAPVTASGGFAKAAGTAMAAGRSAGLSVEHGAEAVLRRAADAEGKPVGGLESFDFQLSMLTSLPPARGNGPTQPTAEQLPSLMAQMSRAWRDGEPDRMEPLLDDIRRQSPVAYRTIYADRNDRWASWLTQRLASPGTVFVAIGTGHLIGRDSLQAQLARRGIRAIRIG